MDISKLTEIKEKRLQEISCRLGLPNKTKKYDIMVCSSIGCNGFNVEGLLKTLNTELEKNNLTNIASVNIAGCFGLCSQGPLIIVYPDCTFYVKVDLQGAYRIINEHILQGKIVEDYLYANVLNEKAKTKEAIDFYKKQLYITRKDSELINPEVIDDYIALNGYSALHKVLTTYTPETLNEKIKESGLRGRGGAGFNTGLKWSLTLKEKADQKYMICNADEGDPGAFMDRTIIEANPHKLIEGMIIAGYGIGATKGIVYVRAEYPLAVNRLKIALQQAYDYGLLGKNIFGSGHTFDIEIKKGAGAFVCGEETALISSVEGKRGEPSAKPPYPSQKGAFNCPTAINNVETLANVPEIILNGVEWFNSIGKPNSKGTKLFALSGKVVNSGLVELPMGSTIREIVYDIGGGIPNGKKLKAVLLGGPSGGCIPASLIDSKIDYENLLELGSMMGSGGLIVMDEDTCMLDIAKFFLQFTCDESCGKCTPCRIGNRRLLEILSKITEGKGELSDLDELEQLSHYVKENSLCGLGQSSPNPILSSLKYFRKEFEEHIINKNCPAGVCSALKKTHTIIESKCVGCSACAKVCPVGAISGVVGKKFVIDKNICINCGACYNACKFGAINNGGV